MGFLAFTLLILCLIAAFPVVVAVTVANRRLKKHGWIILTGRFLAGIPHHGRPATDRGWFRHGKNVLTPTGHATWFQHRPIWQTLAIRSGSAVALLFVLYGLLADAVVTLWCLAAACLLAATYGTWRTVRWAHGRQHKKHWLEPGHAALAARFGHPLALKPAAWIRLEKDRSSARLALPKGRVFDPAEQLQLGTAAITKLGITGADPREDVEWKQAGLEPHVNILRPVPCPPLVTLADIQDAIDTARRDEVVIGIGRRGLVVKVSLAINAPHMLWSLLSGVGTLTWPAVGRVRPASSRSSVVLPAPFGPTSAAIRPSGTVIEQSLSAVTRRYRFVSPCVSIAAVMRSPPRSQP